ncbi:hypothetical protein [Saccharibacillus sp. JS10]|uniref:hypothetical protein n=1 Tax=Saccharibacillus sp. JS10 TaxID=2950552 RepID=UPI00210B010D|nr:hypothetical protein [Saccharibacillus sp. JS10]MCQ4086996.1 hypothetical protein [Saccharibacillus sp. JS10]
MNPSIPFLKAENLVGRWSSEAFFYDAFEDTQLEFHADGTGCCAYIRPFHSDITLFKWSLEDDRIEFVNYCGVYIEDDEETGEQKHYTSRFENKSSERFFKAKGLNISKKEIDVIAFYYPLEQASGMQSFGLMSKELNNSFRDQALALMDVPDTMTP